MFLAIIFAIFVWPAIAIAGLVTCGKEIKNKINQPSENDYNKDKSRYNIHYETVKEEEQRLNEYGDTDEQWGMLQ